MHLLCLCVYAGEMHVMPLCVYTGEGRHSETTFGDFERSLFLSLSLSLSLSLFLSLCVRVCVRERVYVCVGMCTPSVSVLHAPPSCDDIHTYSKHDKHAYILCVSHSSYIFFCVKCIHIHT